MGPLIPLLWSFSGVCPVFQSQGGSLACVPRCLREMDSLDSPPLESQHGSQSFLIQVLLQVLFLILVGLQWQDWSNYPPPLMSGI